MVERGPLRECVYRLITIMRNILEDPLPIEYRGKQADGTREEWILYKRPKKDYVSPMIVVSAGSPSIEPSEMGMGRRYDHKLNTELFTGDGTTKDFVVSDIIFSTKKVVYPYPNSTTSLKYNDDYWNPNSTTYRFNTPPVSSATPNIQIQYYSPEETDILYIFSVKLPVTVTIWINTSQTLILGSGSEQERFTGTKLLDYMNEYFLSKFPLIKTQTIDSSDIIEDITNPREGIKTFDDELGLMSVSFDFDIDGLMISKESDISTVYKIATIDLKIWDDPDKFNDSGKEIEHKVI